MLYAFSCEHVSSIFTANIFQSKQTVVNCERSEKFQYKQRNEGESISKRNIINKYYLLKNNDTFTIKFLFNYIIIFNNFNFNIFSYYLITNLYFIIYIYF